MKLWKKVSLLCSLVLVLVVSVCSVLLIAQSRETILDLAYSGARQKQRALVNSFSKMLSYYHMDQDSSVTSRSLMKYCFTQVADAESVLIADGETLYSSLSFDPGTSFVPDSSLPQLFSCIADGRRLLIAVSCVRLFHANDPGGFIYIVQDITPVYSQIRLLAWQFAGIGAGFICLGVLLIALLAQRSLASLHQLQSAASRIAEGSHSERVAISSSDEVGLLAQNFNTMADAVQQRIEELTETAERQRLLISGIAHEFKTPLTALLLNVDSFQNTCLDEEEHDAVLSRIASQSRWLEQLVQKLLKLIMLEQPPEFRPVSVPALLERVRESTEVSFSSRGISLKTCCAVDSLLLDADLMLSVLVNLADNAAKASAPGQSVLLSADAEGLTVQDHGCGIPPEEIDRITEPFYMVDRSRSKKLGGVGLGLALVKEIVQAHGGHLKITSAVGEGTTVRVLLQQ